MSEWFLFIEPKIRTVGSIIILFTFFLQYSQTAVSNVDNWILKLSLNLKILPCSLTDCAMSAKENKVRKKLLQNIGVLFKKKPK